MKVLLDTNIILDIVLERQPFWEPAILLLEVAPQANLTFYVTATTVTDLYYIVCKAKDHTIARSFIVDILEFMQVAGVDRDVIKEAIHSNIADFEDAVQASAAKQCAIPIIITRNEKDFENSTLEVHSPTSFLQSLEKSK